VIMFMMQLMEDAFCWAFGHSWDTRFPHCEYCRRCLRTRDEIEDVCA